MGVAYWYSGKELCLAVSAVETAHLYEAELLQVLVEQIHQLVNDSRLVSEPILPLRRVWFRD